MLLAAILAMGNSFPTAPLGVSNQIPTRPRICASERRESNLILLKSSLCILPGGKLFLGPCFLFPMTGLSTVPMMSSRAPTQILSRKECDFRKFKITLLPQKGPTIFNMKKGGIAPTHSNRADEESLVSGRKDCKILKISSRKDGGNESYLESMVAPSNSFDNRLYYCVTLGKFLNLFTPGFLIYNMEIIHNAPVTARIQGDNPCCSLKSTYYSFQYLYLLFWPRPKFC